MLYPQSNAFRQAADLSGFWEFGFDEAESGREQGFEDGRPIAVPASWNEIFAEDRDNLGPAWYQTRFHLPWGYNDKRISLRFGSVNYLADVWLNGHHLGQHEGGHLPFVLDATETVRPEDNLLVVRVDGQLAFDRVPPGNVTGDEQDFFQSHGGNHPQAQFDFYPFCGIHRPVLLAAVPHGSIDDITVTTEIDGTEGVVRVRVVAAGGGEAAVRLAGYGVILTDSTTFYYSTNVLFCQVGGRVWSGLWQSQGQTSRRFVCRFQVQLNGFAHVTHGLIYRIALTNAPW